MGPQMEKAPLRGVMPSRRSSLTDPMVEPKRVLESALALIEAATPRLRSNAGVRILGPTSLVLQFYFFHTVEILYGESFIRPVFISIIFVWTHLPYECRFREIYRGWLAQTTYSRTCCWAPRVFSSTA